MSFGSLHRSMIGNIKKLFLPKTDVQKKQLLARSRVCQRCWFMLHVACNLQEIPHVEGVKRNINKQNRFNLRPLYLMSKAHARYWMHDTLQGNIQCQRCRKKKNSKKYIRLHLQSLFVMYTYINRKVSSVCTHR